MRDAQSLLEQLLSLGGETADGRAGPRSCSAPPATSGCSTCSTPWPTTTRPRRSRLLDEAAGAGVQPTDLLGGLLEFLRDVMVLAAGGRRPSCWPRRPGRRPGSSKIVDRWPLDTVLAALQILAEARGRLRGSPHGRLLVELALVRVARLENLGELGDLIARLAALEAGLRRSRPSKKKA